MTIGIYKLIFKGTDKVYIGQSLNIEKRFINHKSELLNSKSSTKLLDAYTQFGLPNIEILEVTSLDNLDYRESYYIDKYSSLSNGFNSVPGGNSVSSGSTNPAAKYDKETYIEILNLLVNSNKTYEEIVAELGVSKSTVQKISSFTGHQWLEYECPEMYKSLKEKRLIGTKASIANTTGKAVQLISPDGELFNVYNYTQFAKVHNLQSAGIVNLVSKKSKTHKGWRLYQE